MVVLLPASGVAQDTDANTSSVQDATDDTVKETIEVKRAKSKDSKHPTLRFLKDNRVFLRARLDELSLQVTRTRTDDAELVDERWLRLKEMSEAIAAARDTVRATQDISSERELLTSVMELGKLEAELNLMEQILAEQRQRLLQLEEDFLGHQESALVILIKGLSGKDVPTSVILQEDSDVTRVGLTELDLSRLDRDVEASGLLTGVWYR
jgi:hypothetical protein